MEPGSVLLLICTFGLVALLLCICLKSGDASTSTPVTRADSHGDIALFPILLAIPLFAVTDRQGEEERPLTEVIEEE